MARQGLGLLCGLLALAICGPHRAALGQAQPATAQVSPLPAQDYPIKRRVRYSFTVQNTRADPLTDAALTTYAPVQLTSTQRLDSVSATHAAQLQVDATGNQLLRFQFDRIAPFATHVITVDAELSLTDKPVPAPLSSALLAAFTRPERYVESDDPKIRQAAAGLKGSNPMQTARNLHTWVRQSLRALQYTAEDRGALRALAEQAGDCTEHAYLFVALARASGMPARAMGGFVLAHSGVLDPLDYHNWAEFYADGAWHLADPHRGRFAQDASHYVAMRVISSTLPNQLGASHRYISAGNGLRVSMN